MPNKGALVPGRPGLSPAPNPAPPGTGLSPSRRVPPPDLFKHLGQGGPRRYELMREPRVTPQTGQRC